METHPSVRSAGEGRDVVASADGARGVALFIRHRTLPGRRDEVRAVWERHMRPAIAANPGHEAYFYCLDQADPDSLCAFQHYADAPAARDFLATESYAAYLRAVEPLLAGPPEVTSLAPLWIKGR